MGQYDPNQQFIGQDGQPLTQEEYQQLMMQQQQQYGAEMDGEYGQEMMEGQQYMQQEQQPEEDPIQDKIQKIIQICAENDALFGDSEFPATDISLYKDPANPPEYAADMPAVEWKRPQEICVDHDPKMIKDPSDGSKGPSMHPNDIKQGILGDCWFLGSLLV